ncbi:MAG TPA: universal stress protein [Stellaceae bacterium]|nr:universal stress protein [Stellaceae bacterium]
MSIKDMLVYLGGSPRSADVIDFAAGVAGRHSARLTALYVVELPTPALFYGDPSGFVDARLVDQMMTEFREKSMAEAARLEKQFRERTRRDGVEGEWRVVEGFTAEIVAPHARYADLTVLGQRNPDDTSLAAAGDVVGATLLSSGRPVLVLPYSGDFPAVGRNVLVAWKSTREAARAVNDALPLLQRADTVTVLAINPERGIGGDGDVPAADIALHLARHGVKASAAHTIAKEIRESDALLNYASDNGADLIVAGGYGHSRTRELVFGGVTRMLLTAMTVPVFLSH